MNTTCLPGRFSGLLRRRGPLVAIAALGVATATLVPPPPPAQATTQTFASAGAEQIFTVPKGVTSLHVVAVGGRGGAGADSGGAGGFGALVTSDVSVTPGQVLYVEVGGNGSDGCCKEGMGPAPGGDGGFNGGGVGGSGGPGAGGGGGASDVRTMPLAAAGSLGSRLVVAAGGGGGGGPDSGAGAGGAAGAKGGIGGGDTMQAGAGTPTAGGAGGTNANFPTLAGHKGDLGVGGAGGSVGPGAGGGGGGGGVYGGGGGAAGQLPGGGGGGGGGASGFASGVTNGSIVADSTGTPLVTLSYTAADTAAGGTPVSNVFKFGKLKIGNASAALKVTVPGPGELSAEDNAAAGKASAAAKKALIKKVELTVAKAGTVTIKIKPTSAGKSALKRKGKVTVKVKVTFAPTGGTPASKTIKVTLKLKKS